MYIRHQFVHRSFSKRINNELITVVDGAYTNHYYIGSQRVASMLGAGFKPTTGLPNDPLQPNTNTMDNRTVEEFADANLQKLALDAQCSGTTLNSQSHSYKTPDNWIYSTGYSTQDVYFYHSDHLGSSSFITTAGGYATQHLQYMAYGEDFIHQQNKSTYKTPYTFSAKEKDAETGFSYFGARYYQADLSIWLSVDPLADKYPHLTPYHYCSNNPVMRVDPNGMNDELVIKGSNSGAAFEQLKAATNLQLSMDGNGKVGATGNPLNRNDRKLLAAITDTKVRVNVHTDGSQIPLPGLNNSADYYGGGFGGNEFITETGEENNIVNNKPFIETFTSLNRTIISANQYVKPDETSFLDNKFGKFAGQSILHEVTEAYFGGKISEKRGIGALPAYNRIDAPTEYKSSYNNVFLRAHFKATKQPNITEKELKR